jgi:hypothetical protein
MSNHFQIFVIPGSICLQNYVFLIIGLLLSLNPRFWGLLSQTNFMQENMWQLALLQMINISFALINVDPAYLLWFEWFHWTQNVNRKFLILFVKDPIKFWVHSHVCPWFWAVSLHHWISSRLLFLIELLHGFLFIPTHLFLVLFPIKQN